MTWKECVNEEQPALAILILGKALAEDGGERDKLVSTNQCRGIPAQPVIPVKCTTCDRSRVGGEEEQVLEPMEMVAPVDTTQADGLGWMEDVWMTVLQGSIVHINCVDARRPESLGFMQLISPGSTLPTQLTPLSPSPA